MERSEWRQEAEAEVEERNKGNQIRLEREINKGKAARDEIEEPPNCSFGYEEEIPQKKKPQIRTQYS